MKIQFFTNLDEAKRDVGDLNYNWQFDVPRQGERICIHFDSEQKSYELAVVGVTYEPAKGRVRVELHIPSHFSNIRDWMKYIKRHRWGLG